VAGGRAVVDKGVSLGEDSAVPLTTCSRGLKEVRDGRCTCTWRAEQTSTLKSPTVLSAITQTVVPSGEHFCSLDAQLKKTKRRRRTKEEEEKEEEEEEKEEQQQQQGTTGERISACHRGTAGRRQNTRHHAPRKHSLCKSLLVT
jgi:hypothetical protein